MKIDRTALWAYAKYANIALSFGVTTAVSILLGYWGGNWVDRRLGTFPIFMVLGVLLGVGASFKSLFDFVAAFERLERKIKEEQSGQNGALPRRGVGARPGRKNGLGRRRQRRR